MDYKSKDKNSTLQMSNSGFAKALKKLQVVHMFWAFHQSYASGGLTSNVVISQCANVLIESQFECDPTSIVLRGARLKIGTVEGWLMC